MEITELTDMQEDYHDLKRAFDKVRVINEGCDLCERCCGPDAQVALDLIQAVILGWDADNEDKKIDVEAGFDRLIEMVSREKGAA